MPTEKIIMKESVLGDWLRIETAAGVLLYEGHRPSVQDLVGMFQALGISCERLACSPEEF
jgi:hypothetical protein